ncbi:MAG: RuvB-like domain-containing protein [Candidatus Diapherotrites archaeon]
MNNIPLAEKLRPQNLDNFIGQEHLVGKNGVIRKMLKMGKIPSIIFWGPPGCGKTTLAKLISKYINADFIPFSAVETKISEILEKEKRKDEIEKERLEMNLKMLNKIEELESTLSKLEKRLEISELERMLEESDSELKELNHEKEVVKEALMKLSDPNYSNEKSTELKDTLENIQNAEKTIMNKMKEITKRIEVLKEEKNAN